MIIIICLYHVISGVSQAHSIEFEEIPAEILN